MEIFERDGKINFVDENNVVLGYDNRQDCCEHANYYIVDEEPSTVAQDLNEASSHPDPSLEGYVFDTKWFKQLDDFYYKDGRHFDSGCLDSGGAVCFRITKGNEQKFIVLFNCHNGYYGHGFEFKEGNEFLQEGTL